MASNVVNARVNAEENAKKSVTRRRLLAGAAGIVALFAFARFGQPQSTAPAAGPPPAVVVDIATVTRGNVPITREGLGSVQAFYTVTVTSQIDGQLRKVAFTEGQKVRKGDLLAEIDPRPAQAAYDQAVAVLARDTAQRANAQRDLERYQILQPQNLTSQQTLDSQKAMVEQLSAQLKVDQALIDTARTQLDYTRIRSPIDGRTGIRLIDPGNIVHAAATTGIVVVTQVQPISVIFTLPEETLAQVEKALAGGPVPVTTLSRDGASELDTGTLTLIDNQIDQSTGTIRLKATFPNSHNALWPGQYVNARVLLHTDHDVLLVPASAVQVGPDGPFTYVVKADSSVEVRAVKILSPNGATTAIASGLSLNERVVTSNQYRLQPGAHVRAATPAGAQT
jgi:multidrug efflux system membrane fusion protein